MGEHLKAMQLKELSPSVEQAIYVINEGRGRTESALGTSLLFLARRTDSDVVAIYDRLDSRALAARKMMAEAM